MHDQAIDDDLDTIHFPGCFLHKLLLVETAHVASQHNHAFAVIEAQAISKRVTIRCQAICELLVNRTPVVDSTRTR